MRTGEVSGLSTSLLVLSEILQASLEEEWFRFVANEIDEILEQPIGPRSAAPCPARGGAQTGSRDHSRDLHLR